MGQQVVLHSTANATERYLTAEVLGDYPGLLRLVTGKINLVEARGVEPLSEDRQHTASTCVADNLISQPSTPVGRLRTAASPEQSRPQPLGTSLGPARCIAPFHPRGPQMEERHSLIKLRVPVLDWQLHFPGVDESPRARHATVVSVSPSKPVAPLLENVQKGF
ncbi:MAG: hypothetical protein K0S94_517 [Nitrospira sp.]|nr:hypothetical protein [Nitrospira sp.]